MWRNAPMFYVDCRGRLLDCFQPAEKEEKAIAFTSWNGHAFFYRSTRAGRLRRVRAAPALPPAQAGQSCAGVQGVGVVGRRDQIGILLH